MYSQLLVEQRFKFTQFFKVQAPTSAWEVSETQILEILKVLV